jgi:4-oxalomesaconate tautomerase
MLISFLRRSSWTNPWSIPRPTAAVIPKLCLIAPPKNGGSVSTRSFIPRACHTSIGVFAAVSVATACVIPGSVAEGTAQVGPGDTQSLSVEHPTGEFTVNFELDRTGAVPVVKRAGLPRTARLLFDGLVFPHPDYLALRPESVETPPTPTP